jgi:hypothetical protein
MIFKVNCAFINTKGNIDIDSHEFSAIGISAAKVAAQEYFTDKHSDCSDFIYTPPKPANFIQCEGPRMTQMNHGKARGVQIVGNAVGTTIVTGDSVQGSYIMGDKIVLS